MLESHTSIPMKVEVGNLELTATRNVIARLVAQCDCEFTVTVKHGLFKTKLTYTVSGTIQNVAKFQNRILNL